MASGSASGSWKTSTERKVGTASRYPWKGSRSSSAASAVAFRFSSSEISFPNSTEKAASPAFRRYGSPLAGTWADSGGFAISRARGR